MLGSRQGVPQRSSAASMSINSASSASLGSPKYGRVRCLLSANTNVAVDRVLCQLAQQRLPNRVSPGPEINDNDDKDDDDDDVNDVEDNQHHRRRQDGVHTIASWPSIARVGCIAKIDKALRAHLVMMADNKASLQRDIHKLTQRDNGNDPTLNLLLERSKRSDFLDVQKRLLCEADVVGVTCASAVSAALRDMDFPVLILDEASQMTEALSLLPMACGRPCKILIVGDPQQLPPNLHSNGPLASHGPVTGSSSGSANSGVSEGSRGDLSRTLFDRLSSLGWPQVSLRVQYRCHPAIAQVCR